MRKIARSQISKALDQLARAGRDYPCRDFDLDLFRLFDDREVRLKRHTIGRFIEDDLPQDSEGLLQALQLLQPMEYDALTIVDPYIYVDNDWHDEAPPEAFTQLSGFIDATGTFIATPSYTELPHYCSRVEDAKGYKTQVFGTLLQLRVEDIPGEWDPGARASLIDDSGLVISTHVDFSWPLAIIGATLKAMAAGWTHKLARFEIVDD